MAYLRWSYSNWYIYWDGMNDGLPKDDQLLFILHKKVHFQFPVGMSNRSYYPQEGRI